MNLGSDIHTRLVIGAKYKIKEGILYILDNFNIVIENYAMREIKKMKNNSDYDLYCIMQSFEKIKLPHELKIYLNYCYHATEEITEDSTIIIGIELKSVDVPCLSDGNYDFVPFNSDIVELFTLSEKLLKCKTKLYAGATECG